MKAFESEDPMELVGVRLSQRLDDKALEEMAVAIVEEYVAMGWTRDQIVRLFSNPHFGLAHRVLEAKGAAYVQELAGIADTIRGQLSVPGEPR
jgi:hypothetical protein